MTKPVELHVVPKVVDMTTRSINNLPERLRTLANQIEMGDFDDAHTLAWVMDCGNSRIEIGLMGKSESPGIEAHFLMSLGAHKIISGVADAG